jgi:chemotaxis protein MotB
MDNNEYFASVEGHTDNTPIATQKFPSNWELSSSRATSVARYLISQGVAANRLRAIGYADTKPKVENIKDEDRARNRRVSITFHYDSDAPLS